MSDVHLEKAVIVEEVELSPRFLRKKPFMAFNMPSNPFPRFRLMTWAFIIIGFIFVVSLFPHHETIAQKIRHDPILDVRNSTLGFQKVFAIGFPDRTDKRDAITLASSYTGFTVDWQPGVAFDDIPKKAAPERWDFKKESPGVLGCWRAHMNVIEKIVHENIQSALILEDDTDWDVSLKTQLEEIAVGMRKLQKTPSSSSSPYGHSWDLAWLGHCRIGAGDEAQEFYVIENDPTVVPIGLRHSHWRQSHVFDQMQNNGTRVVLKANAGMCMFAYAVTQEGARKILGTMSWNSPSQAIDTSFSAICRDKFVKPFNCYGAYPSVMSSHRFAGSQSRDSDLSDKPDIWHPEFTWDIVYSAIQNIPRLIGGAATVLAQWPQDAFFAEIGAEGRSRIEGELIAVDFANMPNNEVPGINA